MSLEELWVKLSGQAEQVAPLLLGCILERELDGRILRGKIVETEAYDQSDAASHSYRGRTPRTDVMFGPPGHLYVYFTYGMHHCCNIVTGQEGQGSAVLIRAFEPLTGENWMSALRGGLTGSQVSNGPAKLCEALGIDRKMNGHDLRHFPMRLLPDDSGRELSASDVVRTTRIGITREMDKLWRFHISGNPYVSRT
jgi:DNA-3-methyladenine glycosylase